MESQGYPRHWGADVVLRDGSVAQLRLAILKNDLAEVARLDLGLVLAGPGGASVLEASGHVSPSPQARSDSYVRRLPAVPLGDTGSGATHR